MNSGRHNFFPVSVAFVVCMLSGCLRVEPRPLWRAEKEYLGELYPSETSCVDAEFVLPDQVDVTRLVLVVPSSIDHAGCDVIEALDKLTFDLELRLDFSGDEVFADTLNVADYTERCNWFYPVSGLVVKGIGPFNYGVDGETIRENQGLLSGHRYRLHISVLDPVSVTNGVQVWLFHRVYTDWAFEVMEVME